MLVNIVNIFFFNFFLYFKLLFNQKYNKNNNKENLNLNFSFVYFLKKRKKSTFLSKYFNLCNNNLLIINSIDEINKNKLVKVNRISKNVLNKKVNYLPNFNFISKVKNLSGTNTNIKFLYKINSFLKNILPNTFKDVNIQFLRKFRVFNKGRYSRNRQFYRTGVYWCLYVNIIAVIGLHFWFYKITMNYNYLWVLLYIFFLSFIFSRYLNFFSTQRLINFLNWNLLLVNNILTGFIFFFNSLLTRLKILLI